MPRIVQTRTRHLPSRPARPGSGAVDRRPFSARLPDRATGRCPRHGGYQSPAASYSEIGKRRQGPDSTPFRPGHPGLSRSTLRHWGAVHLGACWIIPASWRTGHIARLRTGELQSAGRSSLQTGPRSSRGSAGPPFRGTHGPRRQDGQCVARPSAATRVGRSSPCERTRCSGTRSRPGWTARSRNGACGTSAGPSTGRDERVAAGDTPP